MGDRLTRWIGIVGSLITVVLTGWNAYTKSQIDQREAALKQLELGLKERSAGLEESRERVERYKWVLGLFPDLVATDERKRNFTVNLIRLATGKKRRQPVEMDRDSICGDRRTILACQKGKPAISQN